MKKLFLGFCSVLAMASAMVSCSDDDESAKVVESITMTPVELALNVGDVGQAVAVVLPADAADLTLTWGSSDATVATVVNGVVTAVAVGEADIAAVSVNKQKAVCKVTVTAKPIPAVGINCDDEDVELEAGQTLQLTFAVIPADANTGNVVTWESTDADVASVNDEGVVTAVAKGDVTIRGSIENGASVKVKVNVKPSSWVMDPNMVGQMVCYKLQARYLKTGEIYEEDNIDKLFKIEGQTKEEWCAEIKNGFNNVINADGTMKWAVKLDGGKTKDILGTISRDDDHDNALLVNYHVADTGINFGDRQSEYDHIKLGWTVGGTDAVYDEVGGSFYDLIYTCTITAAGVSKTTTQTMTYEEIHSLKCAK